MKKELSIINKDELDIPIDFLKYKYVVFVAKTTSAKYDFILYTMRQQPNADLIVRNKLWHVCAFNDTIDDFLNLGNLMSFTDGLTNVNVYHDKVLLTNFHSYRISRIAVCVKNALKLDNHCLYCQKEKTTLKENFHNPLEDQEFGFSFDLKKKNTKKIKRILAVKQSFPCHQINDNFFFNPYDEIDKDLKEVYLANCLKQNPEIVNFCPFFDHKKYECVFIDEIVIK